MSRGRDSCRRDPCYLDRGTPSRPLVGQLGLGTSLRGLRGFQLLAERLELGVRDVQGLAALLETPGQDPPDRTIFSTPVYTL